MEHILFQRSCQWFLANVSENEALCAVFVMWLYTDVTYAVVVTLFYCVERSSKMFAKYNKIHQQHSDSKMFRDAILSKPFTWFVDVPIYFLSYRMMSWRSIVLDFFRGEHTVVDIPPTLPSLMDPLPDSKTVFSHVLALVIIYDFHFYCWHRILHTKSMWKYHKKHHEVKVSFTCANDHESPVESAVNIFWKMVLPALLGCHVYTVCLFRAVIKFFALLHHSGFELPMFQPLQLIPGIASPSEHDYHHYYGAGNYGGVFSVWDHVFGTARSVDGYREKIKKNN